MVLRTFLFFVFLLCVLFFFFESSEKRLRLALISTERLNARKFPAVHIFFHITLFQPYIDLEHGSMR